MKRIQGEGSSSAKLVILGSFPDYLEELKGKPFIGTNGKVLDELIKNAGFSRSECYLTHVVKFRPPGDKVANLKQVGVTLDDCIKELVEEIRAISPNAILALGNSAMLASVGIKGGISKWRGSILSSNFQCKDNDGSRFLKVIPSYQPGSFTFSAKREESPIVSYGARSFVTLDYKRAWEEAQTKALNLPSRHLEICRSSDQLIRFLERYKNHELCSVDIEVIKCIPICLSFAFTSSHAISVPLMNLSPINFTPRELELIWRLVAEVLSTKKLIGQNFKFDQEKLENVCGFRIKTVHADTSFMAHVVHCELEKKLAFLTSVYTREPFYKDDGREFNIKKDDISIYLKYNAKDAAVTFEVYEELLKVLQHYGQDDFFFNFMMPLHSFYMGMERTGFLVDLEKKKFLIDKYGKQVEEVQSRLDTLCRRPVNTQSPKQIHELFAELGIPRREKVDEDTLCALLANTVKNEAHRLIIENIYTLRRLKKAKKSIESEPDYDKRMRCSVRITGAETGRTSNSVLKAPVRPTQVGIPFQTITKHGAFGSDIREEFVADSGFIFISRDSSQADARIVALLSEDYELLELFDKADVHSLTASWIFNKAPELIDRETERFIGKTTRHAGNYDMQKRRHMLNVTSDAKKFNINIRISEAEAGRQLVVFHKNSPRIKGVFHQEVQKALKDNGRLIINPLGRPRRFLGKWNDELFREAYAQIPQSTVGDNLKRAGMNIKKRCPDVRFVIEAHDSFLVLAPEKDKVEIAQIMKEEMERPIDFEKCTIKRRPLIIPSDCEMGYDYKNMKKVKGL